MVWPPVPDARVERADWVTDSLAGLNGRVESVVPRGYPAYARILHPAEGSDGARVTWGEVAASTGRELHPLAQFASVAGRRASPAPAEWAGRNPKEGTLDVDQLRALSRILSDHTATGDRCWLTVWEGWGNLPSRWRQTTPRVVQPYRAYYLFERRVDEVVEFAVEIARLHGDPPSSRPLTSTSAAPPTSTVPAPPRQPAPIRAQSPSQWWPQDRGWFVGSEIDFDSTLVGGSESLVEQIVTDPHLEAFRVSRRGNLTHLGDTVNPRS